MTDIVGELRNINIYPIKSCHAATVDGEWPQSLDIGRTGLEAYGVADREYVIAEPGEENHDDLHFVTQRGWNPENRLDRSKQSDAKLALIRTNITAQGVEVMATSGEHGKLLLPAEYDESRPTMDINIFNKPLSNALDQGKEAAEFFSDFLGRPVKLVRANRATPRTFKPEYYRDGAVNQTAGADSYPILIVNQASLDYSHDANHKLRGTVPISQYRANMVINGQAERPYDEDFWRKVRIGTLSAYVVKACQRCPIPNIDQETAERGAGGQPVLRGRLGFINKPDDKAIVFGQNLNHIYEPGLAVAAGDPVRVLERAAVRNFTLLG